MAGEVVHVEFPSEDVDRAQRFWSSLFGWSFGDSGMPGMDYRMARLSETAGVAVMAGRPAIPVATSQPTTSTPRSRRCASSTARRQTSCPFRRTAGSRLARTARATHSTSGSRTLRQGRPPVSAGHMPRRSIIFGSRRHLERTLTTSSRKTGWPTRRSTSGWPGTRSRAPSRPSSPPGFPSGTRSRRAGTPARPCRRSPPPPRSRVRDLVAGQVERFLADHLGDAILRRLVGRLVDREVERPFGQQVHEVVA